MIDCREELKTIAKFHRWAYEDLTYDLCMVQANRMCGRYQQEYLYLKTRLGTSVRVLEAFLEELSSVKISPPKGDVQAQLQKVVRYYPWVLDELTVEAKEKEAVELFGDMQGMYRFLLYEFESISKVRENLVWVILGQRCRRKTIHLGDRKTSGRSETVSSVRGCRGTRN